MLNRLFFALVLVTTLLVATVASAQTRSSIFETEKACNVALSSGNYAIYGPVDLSRKDKDPIDNIVVFPVKLEADQCRLQATMKGEKWVVQAEGSLMRARKNEAGELAIFARNDCGNADITPLPPVQVVQPPAPVVTPIADAVERIVYREKPRENPLTRQHPIVEHGHKKWPWVVVSVVAVGAGTAIAMSHWNKATASATINIR